MSKPATTEEPDMILPKTITVQMTGLEASNILLAIDAFRDERPHLMPLALEQLARAEANLLAALKYQNDDEDEDPHRSDEG